MGKKFGEIKNIFLCRRKVFARDCENEAIKKMLVQFKIIGVYSLLLIVHNTISFSQEKINIQLSCNRTFGDTCFD